MKVFMIFCYAGMHLEHQKHNLDNIQKNKQSNIKDKSQLKITES